MLYLSLLLTKTLITIMENENYYSAVLHYLGHKREVVIRLDAAVIDSFLTRGYVVELLAPIPVVKEPALD